MNIQAGISYLKRLSRIISEAETLNRPTTVSNTSVEYTGALLMLSYVSGLSTEEITDMVDDMSPIW